MISVYYTVHVARMHGWQTHAAIRKPSVQRKRAASAAWSGSGRELHPAGCMACSAWLGVSWRPLGLPTDGLQAACAVQAMACAGHAQPPASSAQSHAACLECCCMPRIIGVVGLHVHVPMRCWYDDRLPPTADT